MHRRESKTACKLQRSFTRQINTREFEQQVITKEIMIAVNFKEV